MDWAARIYFTRAFAYKEDLHSSAEKICPWALEHTKNHSLSIYHAALFCTVVFYSPAQYNFNLISCSVNHSTFSSVCFYFYPTSSHLRHRGSALHHQVRFLFASFIWFCLFKHALLCCNDYQALYHLFLSCWVMSPFVHASIILLFIWIDHF